MDELFVPLFDFFYLNVKSSQLCVIKMNKDQLCWYVTLGGSSSRLFNWKTLNQLAAFYQELKIK